MTPPLPTAQLLESLTIYTESRKQPHANTGFPVQVLPSYQSTEGTVGEAPPTAHPLEPLARCTPKREVGEIEGSAFPFVQLKLPPFHLSIVGFPAASASPTAHPSLSLTMKTEFNPALTGEVVVLQIAPDTELQSDRQNAAAPDTPAAHRFPPEGANVTEFKPGPGGGTAGTVRAIWLTSIRLHVGAESSDVP